MLRLWIVSSLLLIGVLVLRGSLEPDARESDVIGVELLADRETSRLFSGPDGAQLPVAAVTVTRPTPAGVPESYFYGRSNGIWRCFSHFGLVGNALAIQELLLAATRIETLAVPTDEALAEGDVQGYGLDPNERIRIEFHGAGVRPGTEQLDVLFAVDLGHALARGGAFARTVDTDDVVVLDVDLARGLRRDRSLVQSLTLAETPPLADPHLIPTAWPSLASGFKQIFVDHADGSGYSLEDEAIAGLMGDAPRAAGYTLVDSETGLERATHPVLGTGYTLFLALAPYRAPVDPRTLANSSGPETVITIQAADGGICELSILPAAIGTDRVVINSWSGTAHLVSGEVAKLLAPSPEQLIDTALGNPWHEYVLPQQLGR